MAPLVAETKKKRAGERAAAEEMFLYSSFAAGPSAAQTAAQKHIKFGITVSRLRSIQFNSIHP